MKRKQRLIAGIFYLIGVPALIVGIVFSAESLWGQISQVRTEGRIVGFETYRGPMTSGDGNAEIPVVEFSPSNGDPVRFTAVSETATELRVGDLVPVRYDPNRPGDAVIDEFWNNWLLPLIGLSFGILFSLGGWGVATGRVGLEE